MWKCKNDLTSSFFFIQAEDGIRDLYVTGVQTCALPILTEHFEDHAEILRGDAGAGVLHHEVEDRMSVVQGKSVDLGGRRIIKKKKDKDRYTVNDVTYSKHHVPM